jgi:hypothetical protein
VEVGKHREIKMILFITDPKMVPKLLPLVLKIENLPVSPHAYLNYIAERIQSEFALLLVNITEDNEINAFGFVESVISITDREAMLNLAYCDPKSNGLAMEMWEKIVKWAQMRECSKVGVLTQQSKAKAMIKKYGFTQNWAYLTKDLKDLEVENG